MEGSQPVEVEGNGGKEGIRSDGLPVEIAAPRDMEAVFVCKTQIGGGLFGGMPGIKALNPIQPRVLQCTEDFLQAPVGAAELAGMGQNRLSTRVMDGRDAFRGAGLPPLNALVFVRVQIAVEGLPEGGDIPCLLYTSPSPRDTR